MPQNDRLLEGEYVDITPDGPAETIKELRRQLLEMSVAQKEYGLAIASLRSQLKPLYHALQQIFGDIAAFDDPGSAGTNGDSRIDAVWRAWKEKLPGAPAKIIDALRTHGELSTQQLAIACRIGKTTVTDSVYKLNRAGLINKAGGRFSLKQL